MSFDKTNKLRDTAGDMLEYAAHVAPGMSSLGRWRVHGHTVPAHFGGSFYPPEVSRRLSDDLERAGAVYVVYVSGEPIGWTDGVKWSVPDIPIVGGWSQKLNRLQTRLLPVDGAPAATGVVWAVLGALGAGKRAALEDARRAAAQRAAGVS